WFLKGRLLASGTWGEAVPGGVRVPVGFASLPALTLLECGVAEDDPDILKAAEYVRKHAPQVGNSHDTYQRALAVLFLDRLGDKQDEELIQYLALCFIAGQHPTAGAWSYSCPALDRKAVPRLLALLKDPKTSLDEWRKAALDGRLFPVGTWDNSNTQFAILGLWVAGRHGVPIDRTMSLVDRHFRQTQRSAKPGMGVDGSWPYNPNGGNGSQWASMTCSGLLGLAVAH